SQSDKVTFNPSTAVDASADTITLSNADFEDQQAVVYHTGAFGDVPIGFVVKDHDNKPQTQRLQDGGTYYLIKTGNGVYKLTDSPGGAALDLTLDDTTGTSHSFTAPKLSLVPPQDVVRTVDP